ncbi:MAG: hypothetical protein ACTSU5_06560 [Promethearchaeota archaeon]
MKDMARIQIRTIAGNEFYFDKLGEGLVEVSTKIDDLEKGWVFDLKELKDSIKRLDP